MIAALAGLVGLHVALTWARAWADGRRAAARAAAPGPPEDRATDLPPTCVLVPVWNDADVVVDTLTALHAETSRALAEGGDVEVVAIAGGDDGSLDRTRAAFATLGVRGTVLPQDRAGKNAALNRGLQHCNADVVVMLDADTLVEPGWLRALVGPLAAGESDATTGRFSPRYPSAVTSTFEIDQLLSQVVHGDVNLFGGGSIALTRAALAAIGGALPEDVRVGVDWDLSRRVSAADLRVAFVPGARVRTGIPHSWREYVRTEVRWRRAYHAVERRRETGPGEARWWLRRYVLAVQAGVLGGAVVLPAAAWLVGVPPGTALAAWSLFLAWVLLRHGARPVAAYAFTRDARYLRCLPAYLLAWIASALASFVALATPGALRADFKGSRPGRREADLRHR